MEYGEGVGWNGERWRESLVRVDYNNNRSMSAVLFVKLSS